MSIWFQNLMSFTQLFIHKRMKRSDDLKEALYCTFYHIASFFFISSPFISFRIISYHFISFHIMSYHFISFNIISYHFISFLESRLVDQTILVIATCAYQLQSFGLMISKRKHTLVSIKLFSYKQETQHCWLNTVLPLYLSALKADGPKDMIYIYTWLHAYIYVWIYIYTYIIWYIYIYIYILRINNILRVRAYIYIFSMAKVVSCHLYLNAS